MIFKVLDSCVLRECVPTNLVCSFRTSTLLVGLYDYCLLNRNVELNLILFVEDQSIATPQQNSHYPDFVCGISFYRLSLLVLKRNEK